MQNRLFGHFIMPALMFLVTLWLTEGCNKKTSVTEKISFGVKVFGDSTDNLFSGITTDKQGNIYYVENQSKLLGDSTFINKVNPQGKMIWRKPVFLSGCLRTLGLKIIDFGDGLIISFSELVHNSQPKTILSRFDYDGNIRWTKDVGIADYSGIIAEGPHNTFMIYGLDTTYYAAACNFDANGNVLWYNIYGKALSYTGDWRTEAGCYSKDGGFIFAGSSPFAKDSGNESIFFKINSSGKVLWADSFSTKIFSNDSSSVAAMGIIEDKTGQIYSVFGKYVNGSNGDYDLYLLKPDTTGKTPTILRLNALFCYDLGGSVPSIAFNFGMTSDNNFYVAGQSDITGPLRHYNTYINVYDHSWNQVFSKTYGGFHSFSIPQVIPYTNGGFVIGMATTAFGRGHNKSDITIMITDKNGNLVQ